MITISHHKILKSVDEARRGEINRIAFHFNSFLAGANGFGLIIIDRFTDKQIDAHLREKFSVGLKGMPYSDTMRLDRIVGFHYGAIGQAHFCSLIDVLMGSTRFVIDAFSGADDKQLATATAILGQMEPLFSKTTHGLVSNLCINFTPKVVKIEAYRSRYSALKDFFTRCGISPEQAISAVRTY